MAQSKKNKQAARYLHTGHEQHADSYTKITAIEHEALHNVNSIDARWLYYEISRLRNFETGVAGLNPRIDSATLRRCFTHQSEVGVKARKLSNNHIQRWIAQLEKAGLIQDRGNHVFYLPLAEKCTPKPETASYFPGISNTFGNSLNVTVTESVTGSKENDIANPINTEENSKQEVLQDVLQKPIVSQDLGGGLSQIKCPIHELDNITLPSAWDFLQLLAKNGFGLNQLHGNKNTQAMVGAWVKAGITLEEAQIGINHGNTTLGRTPDTPTYYLKPVLQVRKTFQKADQQAQEILTTQAIQTEGKKNETDKRPPAHSPRGYETTTQKAKRQLQESSAKTNRTGDGEH